MTNEIVSQQIEKVMKIIDTYIDDNRRQAVKDMIESIGEQYFTAPVSTRTELGGAHPGGLVEQSLKVCYYLYELNQTMKTEISESSIMLVGLFHQLGRIGLKGQDLYIPQTSDWHKSKGIMYSVNEKLKGMTVRDRTIFLLQAYGISLSAVEYQALLLWEGQYSDENKAMRYRETSLALLLHWAYIYTATQEKS